MDAPIQPGPSADMEQLHGFNDRVKFDIEFAAYQLARISLALTDLTAAFWNIYEFLPEKDRGELR